MNKYSNCHNIFINASYTIILDLNINYKTCILINQTALINKINKYYQLIFSFIKCDPQQLIMKSHIYLNSVIQAILSSIRFKQILNRGRFETGTMNPNKSPTNFCGGLNLSTNPLILLSLGCGVYVLPFLLIMDLFSESFIIKRMQQNLCHVISKTELERPCSFCLVLLGQPFRGEGLPCKKSSYSETATLRVHLWMLWLAIHSQPKPSIKGQS